MDEMSTQFEQDEEMIESTNGETLNQHQLCHFKYSHSVQMKFPDIPFNVIYHFDETIIVLLRRWNVVRLKHMMLLIQFIPFIIE